MEKCCLATTTRVDGTPPFLGACTMCSKKQALEAPFARSKAAQGPNQERRQMWHLAHSTMFRHSKHLWKRQKSRKSPRKWAGHGLAQPIVCLHFVGRFSTQKSHARPPEDVGRSEPCATDHYFLLCKPPFDSAVYCCCRFYGLAYIL